MEVIISKHARRLMLSMCEKFPLWFFAARWLILLGIASVPFAFAWSLIK